MLHKLAIEFSIHFLPNVFKPLPMELFSNDQSPFSLVDFVYLPDSPSYIPFNIQRASEDLNNELSVPNYNYQQESIPTSTETFICSKVKLNYPQWKKKTKQSNGICQNTAPSKSKSKRTRKSKSEKKKMEEKKPPIDYIHVRARRGQATDSRSLAERVRREKISKRMKILQGLVPECDKVTGKALILDEIINYVEYLKNQVEFLSLRLASVNPTLHEIGLNFIDFTSTPELLSGNQLLQSSKIQSSHIQSPGDSFTETAASSTTVFQGQGPIAFPQVQDAGSFFMQVGNHTDIHDHQVDIYSMCSFQHN